ncbi:MAG: hypothetical protein HY925_10015 [Elusimicrobia bacterium]|nr:hypothetical protein [Elusimicrobiota bacterium]
MLRLLPPSAAHLDGEPWIYLGRSAYDRQVYEETRGQSLAWGPLFHEEAARLRGPFLDWVGELGREKDAASWWAGALAWKDWGASDLFVLAVQAAVVHRLAAETKPLGHEKLTIVVEDPWLLRQLAASLGSKAECPALPGVHGEKAKAALGGLARRARWALRMLVSRVKLCVLFLGKPSPKLEGVLLYSYLIDRSVSGEGWRDEYLPGLAEELAAAGRNVVRCTTPDVTGFETALAARSSTVVPLLSWAPLSGFLRALFALPPGPPESASLSGMPMDELLRREWWTDLSRASRCAYLLHHAASRRLLAAGRWTTAAMPWEGQPQERLLALAAAEAGIRSVGCQHSTVSPWQLPFFQGKTEAAPLPDALLVPGSRAKRLFEEGGVPAARVVVGGSRRFAAVADGLITHGLERRGNVLVLLPVGLDHARQLLAALADRFPEGGEDFEFVIKPHPGEPAGAAFCPLKGRVDARPLKEALEGCGAVVFCATSGGLEPWGLGHPVLRYRADTLLDIDPLDVLDDATLPTAGDRGLGDRLLSVRKDPPPLPVDRVKQALREVFAPVDRAKWLEAIC